MSKPSLLIVDDESGVRESLRLIFSKDFCVLEANSGEEGLQAVRAHKPELVLMDILMPGMDGIEALKQVRAMSPECEVIMLTALNTAGAALISKESGAFDYVTKPFEVEEIRLRVSRAFEKINLARDLERLREEVGRKYGIENIVGKSKCMVEIFKLVSLVAKKKSTVLITGESGTGKELIARAIHYNSDRRTKPFVVVNCAALPDSLIESELFGYERGAFTSATQRKAGHFELADGGTLFLDEIGELSLGIQAKLLRAVETETFIRLGGTSLTKVDVRIIAASNRDLEKLSKEGGFRSDLFYRLNVVSIHLPPFRERKEDIPLLLNHFLALRARENSVEPKSLSPDVVDCLMSYAWPGNIRELENLIERLTILCAGETIALKDLPEGIRNRDRTVSLRQQVLTGSRPLGEAVDDFEREIILKALQRTDFNQSKAASILGTSRRILRYRMEKLKIREEAQTQESTNMNE
jgi:DNA-binding NtrC family response regulator